MFYRVRRCLRPSWTESKTSSVLDAGAFFVDMPMWSLPIPCSALPLRITRLGRTLLGVYLV